MGFGHWSAVRCRPIQRAGQTYSNNFRGPMRNAALLPCVSRTCALPASRLRIDLRRLNENIASFFGASVQGRGFPRRRSWTAPGGACYLHRWALLPARLHRTRLHTWLHITAPKQHARYISCFLQRGHRGDSGAKQVKSYKGSKAWKVVRVPKERERLTNFQLQFKNGTAVNSCFRTV